MRVERHGLRVDEILAAFLEDRALPGTGVTADAFWQGFAAILADLTPKNRALLARRDELQAKIDAWHVAHRGRPHDHEGYKGFLSEIGYLLPEGPAFGIGTENTDPEIATVPGPQLVVPVTNARYALNAANARWGSLYDCLYGTDAMGSAPPSGGYDRGRGARVVARARVFLDEAFPIQGASHADVRRYHVRDGALLADDMPLVVPTRLAMPTPYGGSVQTMSAKRRSTRRAMSSAFRESPHRRRWRDSTGAVYCLPHLRQVHSFVDEVIGCLRPGSVNRRFAPEWRPCP